jgi:hypothetical protein
MVVLAQRRKLEIQKINEEKKKLEVDRAAVRQDEANNLVETFRIRTDRSQLENEMAIMKKDQRRLERRELQIRQQEDRRRRKRFVL